MNEVRYERRWDQYYLKVWVGVGDIPERNGLVVDQPEWLTTIITLARVGGHMRRVPVPPPDEIVWFTIDESYNLIGFTHEL